MSDTTIIDVFRKMLHAHGCSVDDILETPELRDEYLTAMRRKLGDHSERELLHRLVSLRKRSRLPRSRDIVEDVKPT
jgi:hypothetical protein